MRRYIISLLLVLVSYAVFGQSSDYIDALKAYQSEDYDQAKELLNRVVSDNPANDAAYYYLALIEKHFDSQSDLAEQYLKKALELSPDNFWYKYFLATHYSETNRIELTTALMEELIESNPKNRNLYFELANLYLHQKDLDKAISTLDKIESLVGKTEIISLTRLDLVIAADPQSEKQAYQRLEEDYKEIQTPAMASTLADYHASMYNDSLALSLYNQALEMDETYVPAFYGRAHVYQAMRQYDKYFSDIRRFISDKGTSPKIKEEYLQNIAENPQFVRAFTENIDTLMLDAHKVHPQDSSLNILEGVYFYQTGREKYALDLFQANTLMYPESESIALQYLMMLYYCKHWETVIPMATSMLEINPDDFDIRQIRAIAYSLSENIQGAINDYEYMRKGAPKDSLTIVLTNSSLGDLYYQAGDFDQAKKCFERVLKRDPNNILAMNNYAYYLSQEGKNLKKAKEMSRKVIEAEPDNPTYVDTYAWILHLLGQDVEAKAMFKHAMLYGAKESAVILDHYAEVLYALKEYDLAFIYWEQAKSLDNTLGIAEKIAERKAAQ